MAVLIPSVSRGAVVLAAVSCFVFSLRFGLHSLLRSLSRIVGGGA